MNRTIAAVETGAHGSVLAARPGCAAAGRVAPVFASPQKTGKFRPLPRILLPFGVDIDQCGKAYGMLTKTTKTRSDE
ncbi:MAG: hypothetical protein KGJ64_13695 [Betaproteobacteria bacterium]|nr:hypothetical protein [Betaproteobacteria bacterium]